MTPIAFYHVPHLRKIPRLYLLSVYPVGTILEIVVSAKPAMDPPFPYSPQTSLNDPCLTFHAQPLPLFLRRRTRDQPQGHPFLSLHDLDHLLRQQPGRRRAHSPSLPGDDCKVPVYGGQCFEKSWGLAGKVARDGEYALNHPISAEEEGSNKGRGGRWR
jgi:hypothetical protein